TRDVKRHSVAVERTSGALRVVLGPAVGAPSDTLGGPTERIIVELDRVTNYSLCLGAPAEAVDLHRLVLEHLVVEEESLELTEPMRRQVADVRVVRVLGIVDVNGDDLVVLTFFIAHGQYPNRARAQDTERHHRLLTEDQHVERIAVVAVRLWQEPVVRRGVHGRVQNPVEPEQAGAFVELVLDLRALGDLDDRAEVPLDVIAQLDVVPRVHRRSMIPSGRNRGASRLRRPAWGSSDCPRAMRGFGGSGDCPRVNEGFGGKGGGPRGKGVVGGKRGVADGRE